MTESTNNPRENTTTYVESREELETILENGGNLTTRGIDKALASYDAMVSAMITLQSASNDVAALNERALVEWTNSGTPAAVKYAEALERITKGEVALAKMKVDAAALRDADDAVPAVLETLKSGSDDVAAIATAEQVFKTASKAVALAITTSDDFTTKVPRKPVVSSIGSTSSAGESNASKVRAWAATNGIECNERGRISAEVQEAYDKANS